MRKPDEIVDEFLTESSQLMVRTEQELKSLETSSKSENELREIILNAFRGFHTIKGAAGFLGFTTLQKLTLTAETVLSRIRGGTLTITPSCLEVLLDAVHATQTILEVIDSTGAEGDSSGDELLAKLQGLITY